MMKTIGMNGRRACALAAVMVVAMAGCRTARYDKSPRYSQNLTEYLNFVQSIVRSSGPGDGLDTDDFVNRAMSNWEGEYKFRIVYADDRYASFWAFESGYTGGAHGNYGDTVGTIGRRTGRRVRVADVVPTKRREKLLAELKAGAAKKVGDAGFSIDAPVTITENFFVAKDGLHFVYNPYEIACYAAGTVEVVIPWVVVQ